MTSEEFAQYVATRNLPPLPSRGTNLSPLPGLSGYGEQNTSSTFSAPFRVPTPGGQDTSAMDWFSKANTSGLSEGASIGTPKIGSSEWFFGNKNFGGVAAPALNLANLGLQAYLGLGAKKVAEDNLKFQKGAFSKQFEAGRKTTNAQLENAQRVRASAGSGATPVEEYMRKYGV